MTARRDHPLYLLTRHFLRGLFDFGFLSETGTATFTRTMIGIGATFPSFALLLVQVYVVRYLDLMAESTAQPYRNALLADHAFLIAIPMWIVAFVTVLVGHALFPDETDLRVLGPLPLTRRLIFGGKLLAVALFTAGFILAGHLALMPLLLVMGAGPWVEHVFPLRLLAHWTASFMASGFTVLAMTAIHGLLLLAIPSTRLPRVSAAFRSVMLCALVLALPLLLQLPSSARSLAAVEPWLTFVPPAWFLGVERWLLGDVRFVHLAAIAAPSLAIVAVATASCYIVFYRRFDRVVLRPVSNRAPLWSRFQRPWRRRSPSRPVFAAIETFTMITLRRSPLHQGIVVVLSAVGAGVIINSLLGSNAIGWLTTGGSPPRRLVESIVWAPFVLMFVMILAARTAVLVPIEVRANWIFRVTEQGAARVDQLRAGAWTVAQLGVIVPVALLFPLQWLILGWDAIVLALVALLGGLLLHGILMEDWARIPFTCSYLPGKKFLPQIVITGLIAFALFTGIGAAIARSSLAGHPVAWVINAGLAATILLMHQHRLRMWRAIPIDYEDELPTEARSLKLYE